MSDWIATQDELPENEKPVLIVSKIDRWKMRLVVVAFYVRKHTMSADNYNEDADDADYDESNDRYYTPEGWYVVNYGYEYNVRFDGIVTHWQPLPAMPEVQP